MSRGFGLILASTFFHFAAALVNQQRQRERLQIKPAEPFGVAGSRPCRSIAVLSELATASP
jgi:hypothetical protein